MFPNFINISSPRTGSTWLYKNLKKHPDIWMSPIKEIHYFNEQEIDMDSSLVSRFFDKSSWLNRRWRRKLTEYLFHRFHNPSLLTIKDLKWHFNYFFGKRNARWYASLFKDSGKKQTGDMTTGYSILNRASIATIYNLMPEAKLIFILRNPIQRSWSHALKRVRDKNQTPETMDERKLLKYLKSKDCQMMGQYSQIIANWQEYYPPEQFFIAFFEDIVDCPEDLLLRIYEFLGLKTSPKLITNKAFKKANASANNGRIPEHILVDLAELFYEEIEKLAQQLGGKASIWLEETKKIVNRKKVSMRI